MVERCSALARTGHTQHWTILLFPSAKKPVLSLSLSPVFKYILSNTLCFCVLETLAQHCSAQLITHIVQWTEPGLVITAIELG